MKNSSQNIVTRGLSPQERGNLLWVLLALHFLGPIPAGAGEPG